MAQGATLFRFAVDIANVDVGTYAKAELRVAQHPSEDLPRVVARILAHCLAYDEDLCAGRGLDEADEPALWLKDPTGNLLHWIDVGHPGAERIHRASKAAPLVTIVCHKAKEGLLREREKRAIHRVDEIRVWLLPPELVQGLAVTVSRTNDWTLVRSGEDLMVSVGERHFTGVLVDTTLGRLS
jgi:uncharacterized protein YaeQ